MERTRLGPDAAYHTRLLGPPDLQRLQALFERGADYFEIATGRPPAPDEAPRAFVAGPPSKAVDDKRVIGVFTGDEDTLVGVLDALTDFPDPGVWMMGMLLLDPAHRGRGLGSAVLAAYHDWAATEGAREFRTAVVAHHAPGLRFLEERGYTPLSRLDDYDAGGARPTVIFLSRPS